MKVAVIYPEVYDLARFREKRKEFPPFGVLYLAAVMEQKGIQVEILKVTPESVSLDLTRFDAIAFSIPSSATYGLIKNSRQTSLIQPGTLVMVGGVHPNFYPEETLLDIKPDVVGIGEGEETIIELLSEAKGKSFKNIKGICYLVDSKPTRTGLRGDLKEMDTLPHPARHLLNKDDIVMEDRLSDSNLKMAHVLFSRGCPFPCRFCAAADTPIQYRSGSSAFAELEHLKKEYGIQGFAIVDDNFIVNKRKVAEICEAITPLDLKWSALSRVDTVNRALLEKLYASGCIEIKYGMESGSPRILTAMKKNITPDRIRSTIKTTRELGIKVKVFLVHGFPGEDMESTKETLDLLEELSPYIDRTSLFRFVPLPGTYVFNNPQEFNLRGTNHSEDWDGNWAKYHIHHNNFHWWGSDEQFQTLNRSYEMIRSYVEDRWPETH